MYADNEHPLVGFALVTHHMVAFLNILLLICKSVEICITNEVEVDKFGKVNAQGTRSKAGLSFFFGE